MDGLVGEDDVSVMVEAGGGGEVGDVLWMDSISVRSVGLFCRVLILGRGIFSRPDTADV